MKKNYIYAIIYFILMFLIPYLATYVFEDVRGNDAREFLFVSFFTFVFIVLMALSIIEFTKEIK